MVTIYILKLNGLNCPSNKHQPNVKANHSASPLITRYHWLRFGSNCCPRILLPHQPKRWRNHFRKDGFSPVETFSYSCLPTLITVFYSILWSWVDLDAERLEPYFQMSKPGGQRC